VDLDTRLKTVCNMPQHIAPEVVSNAGLPDSYNPKDDCWSLGVILYILLSGKPRFSKDRKCGLSLRADTPGQPAPSCSLQPAVCRGDGGEALGRGDPAAPLAAGAGDGAAG
jgi:serine/threonine protein kinase